MINDQSNSDPIIQDTNELTKLLETYKNGLQRYEEIGNANLQAWLLLIMPIIGDLRTTLENYEHELIAAAIRADIEPQTLARDLHYSPPTIYRRINRIKDEPQPEKKNSSRPNRLTSTKERIDRVRQAREITSQESEPAEPHLTDTNIERWQQQVRQQIREEIE